MNKKYVCSYFGRFNAEIDLSHLSPADRASKGVTLYLYHKSTKVLTQVELDAIEKIAPQIRAKIIIHREIKDRAETVLVEMKPKKKKVKSKKEKIVE